jgi:hypothetical protein
LTPYCIVFLIIKHYTYFSILLQSKLKKALSGLDNAHLVELRGIGTTIDPLGNLPKAGSRGKQGKLISLLGLFTLTGQSPKLISR